MRKISFRGKTIHSHTWVYGGLVMERKNAFICPDTTKVWWNVEPDTVGQYTGMDDDDGEEIYEGDILHVKDKYDYEFEGVVYFDNNYHHAFGILDKERFWLPFNEIESMTIIGNIHDNPEFLIKEK